jgi:hypothetical protein
MIVGHVPHYLGNQRCFDKSLKQLQQQDLAENSNLSNLM